MQVEQKKNKTDIVYAMQPDDEQESEDVEINEANYVLWIN